MADADGQIVFGSQEGRASDGSSGIRAHGVRIRRIAVGWPLRLVDPVGARSGPPPEGYAVMATPMSDRNSRIRMVGNRRPLLCRFLARASATCTEFHT
jgi:hypothetical protein